MLAALICIGICIYLSIYPQGKKRRIIMRIHRQSGTDRRANVGQLFFIKRRGGERKRFLPKEKCSRWIKYSLFHYNKVFFSVRVIYPQPFLLYFLKNKIHAVLWIHLRINDWDFQEGFKLTLVNLRWENQGWNLFWIANIFYVISQFKVKIIYCFFFFFYGTWIIYESWTIWYR